MAEQTNQPKGNPPAPQTNQPQPTTQANPSENPAQQPVAPGSPVSVTVPPGTPPGAPSAQQFSALHPGTAAPLREDYRDGKLTRKGMEETIRRGGSVLHGGAVITTVDQLPTAADLAGDDEGARQAALRDLDAQQQAIDNQRSRLASGPNRSAPAKK